MRHIISGHYDEVLSDLPKTTAVLALFFVGVYSLSEGISSLLVSFPLVYFLSLAILTRMIVFTHRVSVHRIIIRRLVLSLLASFLVFLILLVFLAAKEYEFGYDPSLGTLLKMEVLIALLFIAGAVGIYGDWRAGRLSAVQPLFMGAIGWAFYLLLWRTMLSVSL